MADFPIYCHARYDTELNKNGKPEIVCKDVSDHDFVEVVRCKDCKFRNTVACLATVPMTMKDNEYCCEGKRRSDNG